MILLFKSNIKGILDMELYQLQYFKAASECGNITQAASKMHVSQPALSMAINKLEIELGVRLFERHRGKIYLNKNGKVFLSHVDKILSDIDEALLSISKESELIRISYTFMFPMRDLIMNYMDQNSNVLIHHDVLVEFSSIEQKLLSSELDLAVTYIPIGNKISSSLLVKPILDDPQYVMMSVDNPLSHKDKLNFTDLKDCKYIKNVLLEESEDYNYLGCINAGFTPKIIYEGSRIEMLDDLVSQNKGITFIGEGGVKMRKKKYPDWESIFRFVPLLGENTVRTIALISKDPDKLTFEAKELYSYILDHYKIMADT